QHIARRKCSTTRLRQGRVNLRSRRRSALQVRGEPRSDEIKYVIDLGGLIARSRVPDVTEVGCDRIITLDAVDRQQHALRFGKREKIIRESLDLKNWNAIVHRGVPERLLPIDGSKSGYAVSDLEPEWIERVRLSRVEPGVPADEVIGIVRIWTGRIVAKPRCVQPVDEAEFQAAKSVNGSVGSTVR